MQPFMNTHTHTVQGVFYFNGPKQICHAKNFIHFVEQTFPLSFSYSFNFTHTHIWQCAVKTTKANELKRFYVDGWNDGSWKGGKQNFCCCAHNSLLIIAQEILPFGMEDLGDDQNKNACKEKKKDNSGRNLSFQCKVLFHFEMTMECLWKANKSLTNLSLAFECYLRSNELLI